MTKKRSSNDTKCTKDANVDKTFERYKNQGKKIETIN